MWKWLLRLPEWQKVAAGILFFLSVVLSMGRALFGWIVNRIRDAAEERASDLIAAGKASHPMISVDLAVTLAKPRVIPEKLWLWASERAMKWDRHRKRKKTCPF